MIFFVIPAYNEEANLETLIKEIAQTMAHEKLAYQMVIVNDGSTDKTQVILDKMASQFPIHLLKNEVNQGLGVTICKGLKKASDVSSEEDIIVTMDGDGTHDPIYVPEMVKKISEGAQAVVASRFARGAGQRGVSFLRKFLSQGSGLLLRVFFPINGLRDYTCGYRAFKAEVLKNAFSVYGDQFLQEQGFAVSPEILIKLKNFNVKIKEIPFLLKYDRKQGKSKINIPKTIIQYLKMIVRLKLRA